MLALLSCQSLGTFFRNSNFTRIQVENISNSLGILAIVPMGWNLVITLYTAKSNNKLTEIMLLFQGEGY